MAAIASCLKCGQETYCTPLHDDKGGPLMCPVCIGKWNAEHTRRRKWGRIIIKAMKMYAKEGGRYQDFDKLKWASMGAQDLLGIDLREMTLGYGSEDLFGIEVGDITTELLADTVALTHPDKHPAERKETARRVTSELLLLKPFVFPAPKPEPVKPATATRDAYSKPRRETLNTRNKEPQYPCELCADHIPYYYCDPCKAKHREGWQKMRDKENAKQRKQYAKRREAEVHYRWLANPAICEICGEQFKGKRKDAKHCGAACRQRAYRERLRAGG